MRVMVCILKSLGFTVDTYMLITRMEITWLK
nr:MAG TPA: protein of unknown function (DUF4168) [Caudoviricetes sp.]